MQSEPARRKRRVNPIRVVIGYILGLGMVLAGVYYSSLTPVGPLPEALPFLESDKRVNVETDGILYFQPKEKPAGTGFIFYPGGRVDHRSYAPLAHALASKGWPAAVVPMPLNLAVLGQNRASDVIVGQPEVSRWVIAGHSLGGTVAAEFAAKHPEKLAGLVFLASYPGRKDFSAASLPVLSIYGSADGLITAEDWNTYRDRFPPSTQWVIIEGGNHAGFGWYGKQDGDNPAAITLQNQTDQILQTVDQFMNTIENSEVKP